MCGQRGETGALGGVGRRVVVPAAVERGVAVLVDQRRQHPWPAPRTGSGTTPPAIPLCTGPSSARTAHVDAGEPTQGVGEPGRADRPVAGVGEEQHVGTAASSTCASRNGREAGRADLLLALDQHLHVAGQRAGGAQPGAHRGDVRDRARLVVGGAAAEQAAVVSRGSNGSDDQRST